MGIIRIKDWAKSNWIAPRIERIVKATLLSVCLISLAQSGSAAGIDGKYSKEELVKSLRTGGHVIFIRHASTEKDYADQVKAVTSDCSTQRTLSEAGWQEARSIGAAFEIYQIPVAQVYSSEYCRAWQTADLAFGRYVKSPALNFEPAEEYSDAQFAAMRERVRPYLTAVPVSGYNTVIVGHDDPFEAATGIYPEPMGVAYVIKPDGKGDLAVIAHVSPNDWFK